MIYLNEFNFPPESKENEFVKYNMKEQCHDSFYPFGILMARRLFRLEFEPITILYGNNGSGKTTALNIIAEKIGARRVSRFNKSYFLNDYLNLCLPPLFSLNRPAETRIITSDDVFGHILEKRSRNETGDLDKLSTMDFYKNRKEMPFEYRNMEDYDELIVANNAKNMTKSAFTRKYAPSRERELSNGETAITYFTSSINQNGLYLLDEPENSLSPSLQRELALKLENYARFDGCQFIISTHSPFLLSLRGAKIYDLDALPTRVSPWRELENIKIYKEFFDNM